MRDILLNKKIIKVFSNKKYNSKIHMALGVHYLQQLQRIYHVEKI